MQRVRVHLEDVGNEVTRVRMVSLGTWSLGFQVSAYLVGDILIDTGFSYVRDPPDGDSWGSRDQSGVLQPQPRGPHRKLRRDFRRT